MVTVRCFKGLPDEINNSLRHTWKWHEQSPKDIEILVKRDIRRIVPLKICFMISNILLGARDSIAAYKSYKNKTSNYHEGGITIVKFFQTYRSSHNRGF
jgi:hypothetical protein